jgi:hypothetical protein
MFRVLLKGLLIVLCTQTAVDAHVMSLDRATLNFRDGAAYMVLSLAPSSFGGIKFDDDGDGAISFVEFQAHQMQVQQAFVQNVQLNDEKGPLVLEGLFVNFEPAHSPGLEQPSILVLGKFAMRQGLMPTDWFIGLWAHEVKNNYAITATVTSQAKDGTVLEQESFVFRHSENSQKLFKKDNHVKAGYIQFGILLLFLIPSLWFFYYKKVKPLWVTGPKLKKRLH